MKSKAQTSDKSSTGSTEYSAQPPLQLESPASSFRKIVYRGHNGYDTKTASDDAVVQEPYGESLTIQAHAEDADINVLMKRYGITGHMPENPRIPTYGDFSNITDYRSALHAVQAAHEGFMEIPAELRARFDNDPQKFLEYAANPANNDDLIKHGLKKAPETWAPTRDTQAIINALKPETANAPAKTEPAPKAS